MNYDDALFKQRVKQAARNGKVRAADVEAAFWAVAWDLRVAIQEQKPQMMDAAEAAFRAEFLPIFKRQIQEELGLEVY